MKFVFVRLALMAVLLVPVYRETGVWTVVTFGLLAFAIEIESALLRLLMKAMKQSLQGEIK